VKITGSGGHQEPGSGRVTTGGADWRACGMALLLAAPSRWCLPRCAATSPANPS
jgi:hypothetical protein